MRENLTAERIARFSCPIGKTQAIFRDTKSPGLGVRVTARNAKTFIYESKLFNKTIRISIGDVRSYTVPQAREKANLITTLIDAGTDPRDAYNDQKAKAVAAINQEDLANTTVQAAWEKYIDYQVEKMSYAHIERGKKWGARHLLDHRRLSAPGGVKKQRGTGFTKAGALWPILKLKLTDVNLEVLRDWQREEGASRANVARQAYEAFRAFWRWCSKKEGYRELVDLNAIEDKELRDEVPSRRSRSSGDALEKSSLNAWFSSVLLLENKTHSALLQVLLLTGARRGEICPLKWKDVDFDRNVLNLHDKVEEDGRKVPLTPYVKTLLSGLERQNEYVFSSNLSEAGYVIEPRSGHNKALSNAGLEQVSIHGLRRTFATIAEWMIEMPAGITAQIMGHKPSATAEKHYKVRPISLLRQWHVRYENWILSEAKVVVPAGIYSNEI
jgi:integrase